MPGNRVERLEEQVQKLESTVDGLTEELLEADERIRQLEAALSTDEEAETDVDLASAGSDTDDAEAADLEKQFEVGADPEEVEQAASQAVPSDTNPSGNTSKGDEDDPSDEEDDIIVA